MAEALRHEPPKRPEVKMMTEEEYFNYCFTNIPRDSLDETKKQAAIENYYRPIFKEYSRLIEEVTSEIAKEKDDEHYKKIMLNTIIRRMNNMLNHTERIDIRFPQNIIRAVREYHSHTLSGGAFYTAYSEYATQSLKEFIESLIQKSPI